MDLKQTHGAFSWMELQSSDAETAREFYRRVIGWEMIDMPMKDGSTYPGIALQGAPVGGFSPEKGLGSSWLPYITVDDVDRCVDATKESGGEIVAEAADAPGVGRIAIIRDPIGAPVALISYEAA